MHPTRQPGNSAPAQPDGVVLDTPDRLVLRPVMPRASRRFVTSVVVGTPVLAGAFVTGAYVVFRPHVSVTQAVVLAVGVSVAIAASVLRELTIVVSRGDARIDLYVRNRLTRRTSRKTLLHFVDVTAIVVEPAVTANARIHHRIYAELGARRELLWYTTFPQSAEHIATRVAELMAVPRRLPAREGTSPAVPSADARRP